VRGVDDGFAVWDTLAITEYLHGVSPAAASAERRAGRARARSLAAEMHAGFGALAQPLSRCPSKPPAAPRWARACGPNIADVRADMARIEAMWVQALAASGGPFLFGTFSAADAFYAPVCMRLRTYAPPLADATLAYIDRVGAAPGVAAWIADALAEQDFLAFEEPYRSSR